LTENSKNYRLLVVAPSGIHLRSFLHRIESPNTEIYIVTSKPLIFETSHPVSFVDFSLRHPLRGLSTIRKIRKVFREFKPDIVHVHQLNSVGYFTIKALRKFKVPIVGTAWGSDILTLPQKGFFIKEMVKYSLRYATAFTSDSKYMAERMRQLLPQRNLDITICNFGVADPIYDLPKENIIYSNRLHKPLYRIDKIIRAFHKFLSTDEGRKWTLVVAATGTETKNLIALTQSLEIEDKVEFVGWLEAIDNMRWYAKAKVWVSIPTSDATAISLLEAMYNGCFPVVVDLPASHEWVTDGDNGRIVNDVDAAFLNEIDQIDFQTVAAMNRQKIKQEGTYAIAEKKFRDLHYKLISQ